jgi:hypothetical protein
MFGTPEQLQEIAEHAIGQRDEMGAVGFEDCEICGVRTSHQNRSNRIETDHAFFDIRTNHSSIIHARPLAGALALAAARQVRRRCGAADADAPAALSGPLTNEGPPGTCPAALGDVLSSGLASGCRGRDPPDAGAPDLLDAAALT